MATVTYASIIAERLTLWAKADADTGVTRERDLMTLAHHARHAGESIHDVLQAARAARKDAVAAGLPRGAFRRIDATIAFGWLGQPNTVKFRDIRDLSVTQFWATIIGRIAQGAPDDAVIAALIDAAMSPEERAKARSNAETPKVEVETPKVEVETPKVEVETPKVEVETPKVEVETPKVEVETPKVETPKVETPKVETPKGKTVTVPPMFSAGAIVRDALKDEGVPAKDKVSILRALILAAPREVAEVAMAEASALLASTD